MAKKRSIRIDGHATSVTIEDAFWQAFKRIARRQDLSLGDLIAQIDTQRLAMGEENLSAAIRLFVLNDLEAQLAALSQAPH